MDERIRTLRCLEPSNSGRTSYQAILETAAGLFGQFSSQDITLRDILSTSGVSNQTLYNYFPEGRDDIAITLYDRFQRNMVDDFNRNIQSINLNEIKDDKTIVVQLSACLARAVFGFLKKTYPLQSAVFEYLKVHNLVWIASHSDELEEALAREVTLHFGARMSRPALVRLVRVCVCTVRGLADQGLMNRDFPLDALESNARKMIRVLLMTELQNPDGPSGGHGFLSDSTGPIAILGAPISPIKRQGILDRILKRKRQG